MTHQNYNLFSALHDLGFIAVDDELHYILDAANDYGNDGILGFTKALKEALANVGIEPTEKNVLKVQRAIKKDDKNRYAEPTT
jgi:hypothetical protein